jgi:hypothetical protein
LKFNTAGLPTRFRGVLSVKNTLPRGFLRRPLFKTTAWVSQAFPPGQDFDHLFDAHLHHFGVGDLLNDVATIR